MVHLCTKPDKPTDVQRSVADWLCDDQTEVLINRYAKRIRSQIGRDRDGGSGFDAEDIAQEIVLEVLRDGADLMVEGDGVECLKTVANRVKKRLADRLAKNVPLHAGVSAEVAHEEAVVDQGTDEEVAVSHEAKADLIEQAKELMEELTEPQREEIIRRYFTLDTAKRDKADQKRDADRHAKAIRKLRKLTGVVE